jgi:hypothetical protein
MNAMHPILAQSPAWQEWTAQLADVSRRTADVNTQIVQAHAAHEAAIAAHDGKVAAAVAASKAIPPMPTPPDLRHLDAAVGQLRATETELRARRTSVLAQIAEDGGLDGCDERVRVVTVNSTDHLRAVEVTRKDVEATLRLKGELLKALDARDGVVRHPSRAEQLPQTVSYEDLQDVVERGRDLAAVPLKQETRILLDNSWPRDGDSREAAIESQRLTHDPVAKPPLYQHPLLVARGPGW